MNQVGHPAPQPPRPPRPPRPSRPSQPEPRRLASFALASVPGSERIALARVAESVSGLDLPRARLDKLKTAVAEATMNAIEHGHGNRADLAVDIEVYLSGAEIIVAITDQGGRGEGGWLDGGGEVPDLARKLTGEQGPRGWGLFLIRNMVDRLDVTTDGERRTVRLTMRTGAAGPGKPAEESAEERKS